MALPYIVPIREIKFECCTSCINREYDKFKCLGCKNGDKYEDEDNINNLTYHEFLETHKDDE